MRVSSAFRPALALALALAGGAFAGRPAAGFDPAVQAVGWNGYGYGYGRGHWHGHPHRPPRYVYVPPRHVYVPPPVVYHRPPCWRLPPWHPAACASPPPRYYRHW